MAQTLVVLTGGFDLVRRNDSDHGVLPGVGRGQRFSRSGRFGRRRGIGERVGGRRNQRDDRCPRSHPADHCHVGDRSDLLRDCSLAAP